MIKETTLSGARQNLASLLDQVTDTREPVYIRRPGKEDVALVAARDVGSWTETDYLLRSPKNAEKLREATDRADAGEGVVIEVDALRRHFGLEEE